MRDKRLGVVSHEALRQSIARDIAVSVKCRGWIGSVAVERVSYPT